MVNITSVKRQLKRVKRCSIPYYLYRTGLFQVHDQVKFYLIFPPSRFYMDILTQQHYKQDLPDNKQCGSEQIEEDGKTRSFNQG